MPPLLWIAGSFLAGYLAGRRSVHWRVISELRREASALLDSVGKLGTAKVLANVEDLKLEHGSDKDAIKLTIKTRNLGLGEMDLT